MQSHSGRVEVVRKEAVTVRSWGFFPKVTGREMRPRGIFEVPSRLVRRSVRQGSRYRFEIPIKILLTDLLAIVAPRIMGKMTLGFSPTKSSSPKTSGGHTPMVLHSVRVQIKLVGGVAAIVVYEDPECNSSEK